MEYHGFNGDARDLAASDEVNDFIRPDVIPNQVSEAVQGIRF